MSEFSLFPLRLSTVYYPQNDSEISECGVVSGIRTERKTPTEKYWRQANFYNPRRINTSCYMECNRNGMSHKTRGIISSLKNINQVKTIT